MIKREEEENVKSFSEKLAAQITKHCMTIGALLAFCEKENVTYATALDGALEDKVTTLINSHVLPDSWLDHIDAVKIPNSENLNHDELDMILEKLYDAAVEGWRRGYIAGFNDRNVLG